MLPLPSVTLKREVMVLFSPLSSTTTLANHGCLYVEKGRQLFSLTVSVLRCLCVLPSSLSVFLSMSSTKKKWWMASYVLEEPSLVVSCHVIGKRQLGAGKNKLGRNCRKNYFQKQQQHRQTESLYSEDYCLHCDLKTTTQSPFQHSGGLRVYDRKIRLHFTYPPIKNEMSAHCKHILV